MSIHTKLTMDIVYDDCEFDDKEEAKEVINDVLRQAVNSLINMGLLSGETELMVDEWKYNIESLEE